MTDVPHTSSIVLLSGGLDSAVLAAQEARMRFVHPVYVASGLSWEEDEQRMVEALLSRPLFAGRVAPLKRLTFEMRDVYPQSHWAIAGTPPAYDTPDEAVYLHGRNIALLSKAAIYAATRGISRLVLAPLAGNPFPDATPEFFAAINSALSLGLNAPIEISAPFAALHKQDIVAIGAGLDVPFELTLSCMSPVSMVHCGLCSKCRERRDAFHASGIPDPTAYASISPR